MRQLLNIVRLPSCPCLLLTVLLGAAAVVEAADRKPNMLIIVADDLGYGELSCQGNPQIPTPHIDSLARSGGAEPDARRGRASAAGKKAGKGKRKMRSGRILRIRQN